jgi:protein-tyrosine kinase
MKRVQDSEARIPREESDSQPEGLLGKRLVDSGTLSAKDVGRIVVAQREQGLLFGEAALSLGLVTKGELQRALADQYAYPYAEPGASRLSPLLVAAYEAVGERSESVRALRSQLLLRWFTDQRKVVVVTSPRSGQGASTIAGNLALSFAQLGERTLLVDANFRTPKQHELFGLDNSIGLSSVLSGRALPNNAFISIASFKNLFVMCSGPPPVNPQELLGRVAFSYLIETAPSAFDAIIIDTPPILDFADAQLVISIAQGCVLSLKRNSTTLADVELAKAEIAPTGATIIGTVLNA